MTRYPLRLSATCQCGKVELSTVGRPILSASCHCASCQEAGRHFERLSSAPALLDPDGGTECLLYRKDRVQCLSGQADLQEHRLTPSSPTRRVVAACCNSAMFLDFTKGHWLTIYRSRVPAGAPPIEMRIMTRDRRHGSVLANDVPNHAGYSGKAAVRLMSAWAAMGFRKPGIPWGSAKTDSVAA